MIRFDGRKARPISRANSPGPYDVQRRDKNQENIDAAPQPAHRLATLLLPQRARSAAG